MPYHLTKFLFYKLSANQGVRIWLKVMPPCKVCTVVSWTLLHGLLSLHKFTPIASLLDAGHSKVCCSVSILLLSQAFKAIILVLFYYNDVIQHNINLHRKGLFLCLKLDFRNAGLFAMTLIAQKRKSWMGFSCFCNDMDFVCGHFFFIVQNSTHIIRCPFKPDLLLSKCSCLVFIPLHSTSLNFQTPYGKSGHPAVR